MKSKIFFKFLTLLLILVTTYYLYEQIMILKYEYIKRKEKKEIFLEKIDNIYKERVNEFYKVN